MKTSIPIQHTYLGKLIKNLGNYLGFIFAFSGFNRVKVRVLDDKGNFVKEMFSYNSRVDVGAKLQAFLMTGNNIGSLTSPGVPTTIALSTSVISPAHGDTTLSGQTAASGLTPAVGTVQNYVAPASLDAAASVDIFHQFTNTSGSTVNINSSALFDSSNNMFVEANLSSQASLLANYILQLTWTINF